jgi:hypothetical protein
MHPLPAEFEDDAEALRRRISLYRVYLINGVNAPRARAYLNEIAKAEAQLAELDGEGARAPALA